MPYTVPPHDVQHAAAHRHVDATHAHNTRPAPSALVNGANVEPLWLHTPRSHLATPLLAFLSNVQTARNQYIQTIPNYLQKQQTHAPTSRRCNPCAVSRSCTAKLRQFHTDGCLQSEHPPMSHLDALGVKAVVSNPPLCSEHIRIVCPHSITMTTLPTCLLLTTGSSL